MTDIEPIMIETKDFRKNVINHKIPKRSSGPVNQFTGRNLREVELSGFIHPDHPKYNDIELLKDKFNNDEDINVKLGGITGTYEILNFTYSRTGGEVGYTFKIRLREK